MLCPNCGAETTLWGPETFDQGWSNVREAARDCNAECGFVEFIPVAMPITIHVRTP